MKRFLKKTIKVEETEQSICQNCKHFDSTRYSELANSKGYCKAKNIILYRTDFWCCLDFSGVLEEELEQ